MIIITGIFPNSISFCHAWKIKLTSVKQVRDVGECCAELVMSVVFPFSCSSSLSSSISMKQVQIKVYLELREEKKKA